MYLSRRTYYCTWYYRLLAYRLLAWSSCYERFHIRISRSMVCCCIYALFLFIILLYYIVYYYHYLFILISPLWVLNHVRESYIMNMCIVFIAVFGNVHDDCLRSAVYYLRTVFGGLGAIFAESCWWCCSGANPQLMIWWLYRERFLVMVYWIWLRCVWHWGGFMNLFWCVQKHENNKRIFELFTERC